MGIEVVGTASAPTAVGPYSQAILHGGMVYVSGQIPLDPATGQLAGTEFEEQARRCLANLGAVLQAADAPLNSVLKVTVYMTDLAHFPILNELYAEFFKGHRPARSCVQVAALPLGVQVEIDAIAVTMRHANKC
ncbi:RidA family protein [Chloroflexota bacterium]